MGSSYGLYYGSFIVVDNKTFTVKKNMNVCNNELCEESFQEKNTNFCSNCGTKVIEEKFDLIIKQNDTLTFEKFLQNVGEDIGIQVFAKNNKFFITFDSKKQKCSFNDIYVEQYDIESVAQNECKDFDSMIDLFKTFDIDFDVIKCSTVYCSY